MYEAVYLQKKLFFNFDHENKLSKKKAFVLFNVDHFYFSFVPEAGIANNVTISS